MNYRQIISYHPQFGHLYVPKQFTRIRYGADAYFMETDEFGFRNSKNRPEGSFKLLVLGDSYAAGDGVANEDRFSDRLANQLDIETINLSVNGFGLDQQLLVYEAYKDIIPHDAVLLTPHMDDWYRNKKSSRTGKNRSGEEISIPKPYFEWQNGELVIKNQPVPNTREITKSSPIGNANISKLNRFKNKTKNLVNKTAGKHLLGKISHPELNNADSEEWQLARAILNRLIQATGEKSVLIAPVPYNYVMAMDEPQYYDEIFKTFESEKVKFINPQYDLHLSFKKNQEDFFLPLCGHFTPNAHEALAKQLSPILQSFLKIKPRKLQLTENHEKKRGFVLGISCFYHDSAAALIQDGKIIAAAQEERFTRKKHDPGFPLNAIHYCLEEGKLHINELEAICFYDNPGMTLERILANSSILDKESSSKFWDLAGPSMAKKMMLPDLMKKHFNYQGECFSTEHHVSHAASAFYPSPFDEAAILVIDGVGEWACSTIAVGEGSQLTVLQQQYYPHSLGLLYSAFTYFCGFKVNSGEYKLMGLAPYGKPIYADLIKDEVVKIHDDGSILLNLDLFDFMKGEAMTNEAFSQLFGGQKRTSESQITKREMDLAASIQVVTEEIVIKMAKYAKALTGKKNLVLAGGVALNCVANGKLLRNHTFEHIWIQPASGDAGGALGAALDYYYQKIHLSSKKEVGSNQTHAYYGPSFSTEEIDAYLNTNGLQAHVFEDGKRASELAKMLANEKIVGHLDGRMEFGPRALGNRSILGDPTKVDMQKKFNLKIKYRESFRPFAPIALEENLSDYFEIDRPSPFMLLVAPVKESLRKKVDKAINSEDMIEMVNQERSTLPSITHVDYSARLQSMNKTDNKNHNFHNLLSEVKENTSYGVLINTSFNVRGEPIVCTPHDAYRCFMRTEMDVLVLGNHYLLKEEQAEWKEEENWKETFELD